MQNQDFYTLAISNFKTADVDIFTDLVFSAGAAGTEEVLPFVQNNREYEPVTLEEETTQLKVYFENLPPLELQEEIKQRWPQSEVFVLSEKNRDWMAEWKAHFKPFSLVSDFWIVPSWCEAPSEAKKYLRIDPGMAFGTGTHETTKLAASFIFDYNIKRNSLIDVGTGTGLLALLAEKMGFERIEANDIDPEARRVARENLAANDSKKVKVLDEQIDEIFEKYDWVVANIIDGVLVKIQEYLHRAVAPGGLLLLTGILAERENIFRHEFSFSDYKIIERRQMGEWVGYLLERTDASNLG